MSKDYENSAAELLLAWMLLIPLAAWFGYVTSTLWGWFVAPLGIPDVSIWQASGLGTIASLFFRTKDQGETSLPVTILTSAVVLLIGLGFGWVEHSLMLWEAT